MLGDQRLIGDLRYHELVIEALGVAEAQAVPVALRLVAAGPQTLRPEVEGLGRADPPHDSVHHSGAGAPRRRAGKLEEGEVGPWVAPLVGIEEVVDGRLILVDRLLDQPQPEQAGVEVDVALRVGRDRRDVVDALELHDPLTTQDSAAIGPPSPGRAPRRAPRRRRWRRFARAGPRSARARPPRRPPLVAITTSSRRLSRSSRSAIRETSSSVIPSRVMSTSSLL